MYETLLHEHKSCQAPPQEHRLSNLLTLAKNGSQTMPLVWVDVYASVRERTAMWFKMWIEKKDG